MWESEGAGAAEDVDDAADKEHIECGFAVDSIVPSSVFVVGESVEARYQGGPTWYSGRVRVVNDNKTLKIDYADGDKEESVAVEMVRKCKSTSSTYSVSDDGKVFCSTASSYCMVTYGISHGIVAWTFKLERDVQVDNDLMECLMHFLSGT